MGEGPLQRRQRRSRLSVWCLTLNGIRQRLLIGRKQIDSHRGLSIVGGIAGDGWAHHAVAELQGS